MHQSSVGVARNVPGARAQHEGLGALLDHMGAPAGRARENPECGGAVAWHIQRAGERDECEGKARHHVRLDSHALDEPEHVRNVRMIGAAARRERKD